MIRFMIFHVMLVFEPLTVKGLQNSVTPAAILPSAGGERDGVGDAGIADDAKKNIKT